LKLRLTIVAALALALGITTAASALVATPSLKLTSQPSGGGNSNPKAQDGTDTRTCESADSGTNTITYTGPVTMWPPNHKMRDFNIVATDSDGDNVTLLTVISSSQPLNGTGDGNTDEDFNVDHTTGDAAMGAGSAENNGQVRGERSGNDKAGRTYTLDATATFDNGQTTCTETFKVTVPHDQGNHNGGKKRRARR
jgi:hypothetical protein